jgi:hypothetical protein
MRPLREQRLHHRTVAAVGILAHLLCVVIDVLLLIVVLVVLPIRALPVTRIGLIGGMFFAEVSPLQFLLHAVAPRRSYELVCAISYVN